MFSKEECICVPEVIPTADSADLNRRARDRRVTDVTSSFLWLALVFPGRSRALFVGKEAVRQKSAPVPGIKRSLQPPGWHLSPAKNLRHIA